MESIVWFIHCMMDSWFWSAEVLHLLLRKRNKQTWFTLTQGTPTNHADLLCTYRIKDTYESTEKLSKIAEGICTSGPDYTVHPWWIRLHTQHFRKQKTLLFKRFFLFLLEVVLNIVDLYGGKYIVMQWGFQRHHFLR